MFKVKIENQTDDKTKDEHASRGKVDTGVRAEAVYRNVNFKSQ